METHKMKKLLLLEDDTMIASGIIYALNNEGYEVLESKKFASLKKPVNPNGFLTYPVYPE